MVLFAFTCSLRLPRAPSSTRNSSASPRPINGQLTQDLPHKGDLVDSSNKIKLIQSITIDRSRLVSVQQQYEVADAKANLARSQIAELAAVDKILAKRTEEYRTAIQNRFDREMPEIRVGVEGLPKRGRGRRQATMRAEQMGGTAAAFEDALGCHQGRLTSRQRKHAGAFSGRQQKLRRNAMHPQAALSSKTGLVLPFSEQERSRSS